MRTLFFVYLPGCPACKALKPIVGEFLKAHPDVGLVPVNLETTEWRAKKWAPVTSPTLIKLENGRHLVWDGYTDATGERIIELEDARKWLATNF